MSARSKPLKQHVARRLAGVSDGDLLLRWGDGDRTAGEELVDRYFGEVYGFFRRRVAQGADDLVQETFLGCLEARARFRGESSFRTFLFSVSRNILCAHFRNRRRGLGDTALRISLLVDPTATPSQQFAGAERQHAFRAAFASLPSETRFVLELVVDQGLSGNEVAGLLGVPLDTAYTKIRRAKLSLRERLVHG